MNCWSY